MSVLRLARSQFYCSITPDQVILLCSGDAILEEGEEEEEEEVELAPGVAEQAEEPQSVEGEKMIEALVGHSV